jgi:plasmid stabilization system protein ParE
MVAKLIVAPEAEDDVAESYAWYEDRRLGLGEELLSCIDACIESICRAPEIYSVVYGNYRRALTRRFPYSVFYEYVDDTVTVYGVLHTSHDPDKWRKRLP